MPRKLALLALVLFAFTAFARTRAAAHPTAILPNGAGTVSGTVSAVNGNRIEIAAGEIALDATNAKIVLARGAEGRVADIRPGMQLFATVRASNPTADGPGLPATLITVSDPADVTISGVVSAVDRANRLFIVLNTGITVDANTSFGGSRKGTPASFDDVMMNVAVHVQADVVDGKLVAREVLVIAPVPPQVRHLRGTVKSIGADSWTIDDLTVTVNAQTKIAGSPKVGDTVEVVYTVDSANNFTAVSIIKFERIEPPKLLTFRGTVKAIAATEWTVEDRKFAVNERTQIMPGIKVGDVVQVLAVQNTDGTLTAISIFTLRF